MKERHPANKKYSIEEVFKEVYNKKEGTSKNHNFDGNVVNMASGRYLTFKEKGIECVSCGIRGEYFLLEKDTSNPRYHFNLFAIRDGKEVLMTKDHIMPKVRGGIDHIDNYQTMCEHCNSEKGSKVEGLPDVIEQTNPWNKEELLILKKNKHLSTRSLKKLIPTRSKGAIKRKLKQLILKNLINATKICKICCKEKLIEEFPYKKGKGHNNICTECYKPPKENEDGL